MALDILERRSRFEPKASKRIAQLTERDLLCFEKLHRHGPLPTEYLLAYSANLGMAENRARDRLTQLYHEKDTPNGGRYLTRPVQQQNTPIRNQCTVHDLREPAFEALQQYGKLQPYAPAHAHGMWWQHDFMLACFTSSIELACLQEPEKYRFIFHDEICAKADRRLSFEVKYDDSHDIKRTQNLKPDRVFGIQYLKSNITRYYLVEADRGTETINSTDTGRKRLLDNDLQYRQFIGELEYKKALKFQGGIVLLNIFTSETRMNNLMTQISPANYMAFKSLPMFGGVFKAPPILLHLFTEPWQRPGREPFYLNQ